MYSFNTAFNRIIDHCVSNAASFQHFQSLIRLTAQIFKLPKLNRLGWTRLGACRLQSCTLPIRAESTLECASIVFILLDNTKRATHNAVRAAVAYIWLNEDGPKFHTHDRARRACFQAAGHLAMLADIRREAPRRQLVWRVAS